MPSLQTLPSAASTDDILAALDQDGACIVADLLGSADHARLMGELTPLIDRTAMGTDDFTGRNTSRTGALVARSPASRDAVMHKTIVDAASRFLSPWCQRILLHLTQIIRIMPGQGAQILHRDRLAWGGHLPMTIEPQLNTIWALSPFTAQSGATRVAPGSHRWEDEARYPTDDEVCQAEMETGSVLIYTGSVIHGGGENKSDAPRIGMNLTYCLGWLRTEENQYLSCPPEVARTLPEDLRALMGYTMGSYALGYYSEPAPQDGGALNDLRPPEAMFDDTVMAGLGDLPVG